MKSSTKRIVVIGGGTGSFTLLTGLKDHTEHITALVNMADDGGSTGILRDELGVLPPGDVRQCLVALSESSKTRDLFNFRFDNGSLKGHNFGNLFLSAVEKMADNFPDAVKLAAELLNIKGNVLPMTTDKAHLVMTDHNGKEIKRQFEIGSMDFGGQRKPKLRLEPACELFPEAGRAIERADVVVIAPGNLYGSLAPALIVNGVKGALEKTSARIVYVCNLVTKPGQTDDFQVHDYASEVERFIGSDVLDLVIYNNQKPDEILMKRYAREGEYLVRWDVAELKNQHYEVVGGDFIDRVPAVYSKYDAIASHRSLIRHNTQAIANMIMQI